MKSNAGQVAGRMERFLTRFPKSVIRADQGWLALARRLAQVACESVVTSPDEQRWIPAVVAHVTVVYFGGETVGMTWTVGAVGQAMANIDALASAGRFGPLFDWNSRDALRETLRQWVATPEAEGGKRRDERDLGDTDDEIVHRLLRVLGRSSTSEFDEAGSAALAARVESFAAGLQGGGGMPAGLLQRFLGAILATWRAHLESQLGPLAKEAMRRAWIEAAHP